jgi:hypothetical protein
MNVVATEKGRSIELQGTTKGASFSEEEMLALARSGIAQLVENNGKSWPRPGPSGFVLAGAADEEVQVEGTTCAREKGASLPM